MSVSVEDKIELFRDIIFKDIEESSYEKWQNTAESFEQEKNRLLKDVEAKRDLIVKEAEKKAEKDKQRLIEKAKSIEYHQLLDKRQQFINEITDLLTREAKSFTSSEDYKGYLTKNLTKAVAAFGSAESVELYFTNKDLTDLKDFIMQSIASGGLNDRFELRDAGSGIIGGFYAIDGKRELQVDYTLKSLIDENRELIGSSIYRRLDEVQGNG